MSKFVRNVSLYLLIIIVVVSIVDAFTTNKSDKSEITYTNFMSQVQQKNVDAVQITDDHAIVGQLKDGTSFTSYAPTDPSLLPALRDADVVSIAPTTPSGSANYIRIERDWLAPGALVSLPADIAFGDDVLHNVRHVAVTEHGDPFAYERYLYSLEWVNPTPEVPLTEIRIRSNPVVPTTLGLLAVTLLLA